MIFFGKTKKKEKKMKGNDKLIVNIAFFFDKQEID